MSKIQYSGNSEMTDKIQTDTVYSIVLKKGSTHNIIVKEKGEQNLFGNVAIERIIYMHDKKGQPKCEFGFCENIDQVVRDNKEINVIEATRVFISLPRTVIIPYDNIGLVEEGPFSCIESSNAIGTEIKLEDSIILDKLPMFKPYHSKEVGGFYQNPVIIKNPFKVIQGGNTINTEVKEAGENK